MDFQHAFDSLTGNINEFKAKNKKKSNKVTACYNKKDSQIAMTTGGKSSKSATFSNFVKLSNSALRGNIIESGFDTPTPIQKHTISVLLERKSLVASAPTGSGKTAAYLIPIIENLAKLQTKTCERIQPLALIVAPTQELVKQIFQVACQLSKNVADGCVRFATLRKENYSKLLGLKTTPKNLPANTVVLISTPFRIGSLIKLGTQVNPIDLSHLQYFVIDECDKMLEVNILQQLKESGVMELGKMKRKRKNHNDEFELEQDPSLEDMMPIEERKHATGKNSLTNSSFRDQLNPIFTELHRMKTSPKDCCFALFSATVNKSVNEWLSRQLTTGWSNGKQHKQLDEGTKVIEISVGSQDSTVSTVDQEFRYCATEEGKLLEIQNMLVTGLRCPCLIFLDSRERAKDIHREIVLSDKNLLAEVVSGDKSEAKRDAIIRSFCQGKINVLICTDLLCRGIDFKNVIMVINYDAPVTKEDYIHRVGRTGRAGGVKGSAITFWTDADLPHMSVLMTVLRASVNPKRANDYEELQHLVDAWLKRRAGKIQSKNSAHHHGKPSSQPAIVSKSKWNQTGHFVVSQRRRERKLAGKLQLCVDSGVLDENFSRLVRPWVPNRKRTSEIPGSFAKKIKDANS